MKVTLRNNTRQEGGDQNNQFAGTKGVPTWAARVVLRINVYDIAT